MPDSFFDDKSAYRTATHINNYTVKRSGFVNVRKNSVMYMYVLDIFHTVHFYRWYYHKK